MKEKLFTCKFTHPSYMCNAKVCIGIGIYDYVYVNECFRHNVWHVSDRLHRFSVVSYSVFK